VTRVALVTGGTKNIGRAVVETLLERGHRVAINGRNPDAVAGAVESLRPVWGDAVLGVTADVSVEADVQRMVRDIRSQWGRVDIVVNNAGLRAHGPLETMPLADWESVMGTVLTGSFLVIRETLAEMREAGWGRVVNIAGFSAQAGAAGRAPVVAAKAGIMGLTRAVAHEGADSGVTANAISPGFIATDRSPTLGDDAVATAFYEATMHAPIGRLGRPEDIARLCAFLCDEESDYITGQVYAVNGGAYM
jgi:NAD(P)-dependent dehydrogenase (short-subunit alcohol dehydrogenase family)